MTVFSVYLLPAIIVKLLYCFVCFFFFQMESNNNCCHMNKQHILNLQQNLTQTLICSTQLLTARILLTNKRVWLLSIKPPSLHPAETPQLLR